MISDFIRAKIRKRILNATGIKPVTFMHFYRKPTDEAISPNVEEDKL